MSDSDSNNIPEYVYVHNFSKSLDDDFDRDITIISINKLNDNAEKVKLSTINKKCYINGYGLYEPKK